MPTEPETGDHRRPRTPVYEFPQAVRLYEFPQPVPVLDLALLPSSANYKPLGALIGRGCT